MRFFIITYFLLITSLSFFSSCQDEQLLNEYLLAEEFYIQEDNISLIQTTAAGEAIEIKILSIEDNRCPADAICVWNGNVKVTFTIDQQGIEYSMCLGQCDNTFNETDELSVQTSKGNFMIKLLEVSPYPGTGDDTRKKAKFSVTQ